MVKTDRCPHTSTRQTDTPFVKLEMPPCPEGDNSHNDNLPQGFAGFCFHLYFLVLSGEETESTRALDKEQAHSHYLGRGRAAQRKVGNIFMGILVKHAESIVQAQTLASSAMSEDVERKLQ